LDIAAQGGEQGVPDGGLAAHLKVLDSADLLDGAVVLLNMPVPVVLGGEGFPVKGGKFVAVGQVNCIVARRVFQPCPEQFDVAEVLKPDQQAIIGDVELLFMPCGYFRWRTATPARGFSPASGCPLRCTSYHPSFMPLRVRKRVPAPKPGHLPACRGSSRSWFCLPSGRRRGCDGQVLPVGVGVP